MRISGDRKNKGVEEVEMWPLRDSVNTDIPNIAPGYVSDFVVLIEQNRRRSQGYVEDFAIEARRKMTRRRDARWDIGIFRVPKLFPIIFRKFEPILK